MITAKKLGLIGVVALIGVVLAGLIGCSSGEPAQPAADSSQEWVIGTITSMEGEEIIIDATSDSSGNLKGPIRVGTSALDTALVDRLDIGTEVEVMFSGQMGMSAPPFISATSLVIK